MRAGTHTIPAVTMSVAVATALLVMLLQVNIIGGFESSLDAGWGEVLNWGFAHRAQWGKGLVFTFGPLGFMAPGTPFDPSIYWPTLTLQHVFAAATALLVVVNLRRLPLMSGLAFLLATIVMGPNWSTSAALIIVYPLAILPLEHVTRRNDPTGLHTHLAVAALAAYAALLPLIKFSTFPLWVGWLPLGTFILWRSHTRLLMMTFWAISLIAPVTAWLACGQHFANLPSFFATSWQIAVRFGAAMQGAPAESVTDWVALGTVLFGIALTTLLAWGERHSARRISVYLMFALTLALAYRAGTTRADGGHLGILWSISAWCAPLLIGILYQRAPAHGPRQAAMAFALALLALTPQWLSNVYPPYTLQQVYSGQYTLAYVRQRIDKIVHPRRTYQERVNQWTADRKKLAMPKIVHAVGHDSVDVLMNSQSELLANGLHYDPRPVFQSYSAYSGKLSRLNEAFFESSRAPRWVMLHWNTIDNRYPTSDDALALVRILQSYRPILSEGAFLLFRRATDNAAGTTSTSAEPHTVDLKFGIFNEIPPAPFNAWLAKFDVRLTLFGKLEAMIFREPKLRIEVRMQDGSIHRYTIVRTIAKSGFMLSPAIADNDQYLDWLDGGNERDVVAVRLIQQHFLGHPVFAPPSPLSLYATKLPKDGMRTLALYASRFPGFSALPVSEPANSRNFMIGLQRVLFVPAPGLLTFDLPPGTYDVSAKFGLMPNALTDPGCLKAHPDGIGIQLGIQGEPADLSTTAYLDPYKDPQHRYAADFLHRLEVGAGQTVTVSLTSGPPGSNGACDWSWIRDLRFEPSPSSHG